jgi:hypothetical protein
MYDLQNNDAIDQIMEMLRKGETLPPHHLAFLLGMLGGTRSELIELRAENERLRKKVLEMQQAEKPKDEP